MLRGVSRLVAGVVTVAAVGGTIQVMAVMGLPHCGQGRAVVMAASPGTVPPGVPRVVVVPGVVMVPLAGPGGMGPAA
jgi:hypothetical protein